MPRTRFAATASLAAAVSAVVLSTVVLSGCSGVVPLEAADAANDPGCAEIVVRLPDAVGDLAKRQTDAQGTGAWGDPAGVLLRCGVPVPGPTTMPCVSVNGIDWIQDDSDAPRHYRFITFGRKPATEIIVDHEAVSNSTVLADLTSAVSSLTPYAHCTSVSDTYDTGSDATLSPTPAPTPPAPSAPTG